MTTEKAPEPLECSKCGGSSFSPRGGGRWECDGCKSTSPKDFVMVDQTAHRYRELPEILAERLNEQKRNWRAEKINENLCVNFPHSEPVAIIAFGDPHLDDPGTDMAKVIEDINHVKDNENTYGICVGDITNNWVGRLQALHGNQSTTVAECWMLIEWFCEAIPWMAMVLGNHDKWNDGMALLSKLTRGKIVQADECAYNLTFDNGRNISIQSRHKWRGSSIWNPAHGISKHAQLGNDYDIIVGGHTHVSAYVQVLGARKRTLSHCVQLASYKKLDGYARSEGFKEHNISPSMCFVLDPNAKTEEDKVVCTYSVEKGLLLHKALLAEYRANNPEKKVTAKKTPVKKAAKKAVVKAPVKKAAKKVVPKAPVKKAAKKSTKK